ncbi:YqkE family protein [Bacillus sp. S14(2024)]|uniref:YqkE family protein n=1 Tax=Bacillus sp. S14(2024) TaxID=3162884 RepID=UPI003D25083E
MAKKKQKQAQKQTGMKLEKETVTIGDQLNEALMKQLKSKQKELKEQEEQKKEAELERKRKEQREREKNKSFEELLGESSLSWKDFK